MSPTRRIDLRSKRVPLALLVPLVAGSALAGCEGVDGPDDPGRDAITQSGSLVIVGGGLSSSNEEVYASILAGREGEGPLCVIPTASGDPEYSLAAAASNLDAWGGEGTSRGILLSLDAPERADDPAVAEEIRGCSAFFFTGGDQSRILDFFLPEGRVTAAYEALMDRFAAGAGVSGSSAGAAMVSDPMIAGGSSEDAFRHGVVDEEGRPGVYVRDGMGLMPGTLIDQHFLARGRIGRLIVATLRVPGVTVGWGVDENTALVVSGAEARVVGASAVVLVDARAAVGGDGSPASVRGLRIQLLGHGDRVDLRTLEVRRAPEKTALTSPRGEVARYSGGVFDRWAFLHLLHRFPGDAEGVILEAADHTIRLVPETGFRAAAFSSEGVEGTPHGLSVGPIGITIDER